MIAKTKTKESKLIPAVGYIRMSSDKQEKSPEQQREEIIKLADRSGCRIIRFYEDLGISGDATEKRKDFQRMIHDAERKGDFRVVLCWDQDRFGRFDSIEAGRWIHPLRQAGVRLITVAQGEISWSDFQGRLMYTISQEGKHQFLLDLSRNSVRGKIGKAASGAFVGGVAPWGYDRVLIDETGKQRHRIKNGEKVAKPRTWNTTLAVSQDKALVDLVRSVFMRYAHSEISIGGIVAELNARKAYGSGGKPWSRQQLKQTLNNPIYCGDLVWNRSRVGKYHVARRGQVVPKALAMQDIDIAPGQQRVRTSPEDWIVCRDHVPAIVDRKTWTMVQEKMERRSRLKKFVRRSQYVLTGNLFCGHCGARMCGQQLVRKHRDSKKASYVYRRYVCSTYGSTMAHGCNGAHNAVDAGALESFVVDSIQQSLLVPDTIERLKREIRLQLKGRSQSKPARTSPLKRQLADLNRKIERGTENLLLADPENLGTAQQMLNQWREERTAIERQLAAADCAIKNQGKDVDALADAALAELSRLSDGLRDDDEATVKEVISQLVERIELWFDVKKHSGRKWSYFSRGLLVLRMPVICQELSCMC